MRAVVVFSNQEYACTRQYAWEDEETLLAPYPPVGAVGNVVSDLDDDNEIDVDFPDYPCPAGPDTSWVTHISMVAFFNDPTEDEVRAFSGKCLTP